MIRLLFISLLLVLPVRAEEVVGALSQNRVAITANFDGSEIFVYGAVKREAPVPEDAGPLEVAITIEGPSEPIMVREKQRKLGIWVNSEAVEVDQAPAFYTVATTGPLEQIISATDRLRHGIGLDKVVRLVGAPSNIDMPERFTDAVVRIKKDQGLYSIQERTVDLTEETLFRTTIALPANLVEGDYRTRMYLMRDRDVISVAETTIVVHKSGLERLIYNMAHEQPLLYGILSILVALAAGWGASEAFRMLRR